MIERPSSALRPSKSRWESPWLRSGSLLALVCIGIAILVLLHRLINQDLGFARQELSIIEVWLAAGLLLMWLVLVSIRTGQLVGPTTDPAQTLDLETKQQTTLIAGLTLIVTISLALLGGRQLAPIKAGPEEVILVGSGNVMDLLRLRGVDFENELIHNGVRVQLRAIESNSANGVAVMASAWDHGREQDKRPLVLAMASYDVTAADQALLSDATTPVFYRVELERSDEFVVIRKGRPDGHTWPRDEDFKDPLQFLKAHNDSAGTRVVLAGSPLSGSRIALEGDTSTRRGASRDSIRASWSRELGEDPSSLNIDLTARGPVVIYGTVFKRSNGEPVATEDLRKVVTKREGWSIATFHLMKPRPLLILGRTDTPRVLPLGLRVLLKRANWSAEGVDLNTGVVTAEAPRQKVDWLQPRTR